MAERIGVFICDCGTNISEVVDTGALLESAKNNPEVVIAEIHRLWCSEEGRERMRKTIVDNSLSRVVVAACSPKQHEQTFQKVLASAGLNPWLVTMANIREQVAWVTKDKNDATKKALSILNAAISRVRFLQPLEKSEIECKKDFLVIGSGVSGMSAALTLAQKNRKVYLVEKEPWIGGKVAAYEDVFPKMECAPCMLEPKMDEILHHERIEVLTYSEITNLRGFFGNFQVDIKSKARQIDAQGCIGCGACYDACPVKVKNKYNGNLSERHAIFSAFAGVLPNLPVIDRETCLRDKGEDCTKCKEACPFGAVDYDQQDKTITAEVGAIVACPGFDILKADDLNSLPENKDNIFDAYQFERMLSSTGPTEGKLLKKDGAPPRTIAFINCAGSRDASFKEYCSGVCCAYNLKLMHLAKKKLPDLKISNVYSDFCLPGKNYQEFYNKISKEGADFIRVKNPNEIKITSKGSGYQLDFGTNKLEADMVILASAMVPAAGTKKLAALLGISLDKDGFLAAEHDKLSPASSATRGIYIAGAATGPRDISQAVAQGQAAAGMALSVIVPGEKLELEVATSKVDEKLCGGCRTCIPLCPYQAINFDTEKKTAVINEILCKGCGVCAAACPASAITSKHFTDEQIFSEIEGVLS